MIGFRVIFTILLLFAGSTSVLAVSGLVGSSQFGSSAAMNVPATATTTVTASTTVTMSVSSTSAATSTGTVTQSATTAVSSSSTTATTSSAPPPTLNSSLSNLGSVVAGGSPAQTGPQLVLVSAQRSSLFLAPVGWTMVVGAWIWRGRVRARWRELGFESDVFELFMKMKGGATRIRLLDALEAPKDRLQIAQQLGVDWKTVDRHVQVLSKYGFVHEQAAYGTLRVYEVTPLGKMLLKLFDELDEASKARLTNEEL